jgi:hypothetical protein
MPEWIPVFLLPNLRVAHDVAVEELAIVPLFICQACGKKGADVDAEYLKVFANVDAAEKWLEENDTEGVAFEYEVLE